MGEVVALPGDDDAAFLIAVVVVPLDGDPALLAAFLTGVPPGPPPKDGLGFTGGVVAAIGALALLNEAAVGLLSLSATSLLRTFFTVGPCGTGGALRALASEAAVGA